MSGKRCYRIDGKIDGKTDGKPVDGTSVNTPSRESLTFRRESYPRERFEGLRAVGT